MVRSLNVTGTIEILRPNGDIVEIRGQHEEHQVGNFYTRQSGWHPDRVVFAICERRRRNRRRSSVCRGMMLDVEQ